MDDRLFLFLLLLFPLTDTFGQSPALANFIQCVEVKNGADNLLINGRPYLPSHPKADGHPYFQTKEWRPGNVYINGHSFPVSQLKYNLSTEQLIIKQEQAFGGSQEIVLSDLLVDSFQIEEHLFVQQDLSLPEKENSAYFEKIFAKKLSFFRLQKKILNPFSNAKPYGYFSDSKDIFFLLLDGTYHKIKQKKAFLACFPDHKVAIKKHLENHSVKWKKMTKTQLVQLLKFCDDQI